MQARLWENKMRAMTPTRPQHPPALPPLWFLPGLPDRDQKGRSVAHGGFRVKTLLLLEASRMCREATGMPKEGIRGTGGMPEFGDSICHICGAQSPGFEKWCAHLLAVLPEVSHLTFLRLVSSVKRR